MSSIYPDYNLLPSKYHQNSDKKDKLNLGNWTQMKTNEDKIKEESKNGNRKTCQTVCPRYDKHNLIRILIIKYQTMGITQC